MADDSFNAPADPSLAEPDASPTDGPPDPAAELRRERDDFKDKWLRKTAEFDNYRKRIDRERREQADTALADLLDAILVVVDGAAEAVSRVLRDPN